MRQGRKCNGGRQLRRQRRRNCRVLFEDLPRRKPEGSKRPQLLLEDGILDGDYVIITRRDRAENGEMVVANVNGEVTLKRFYYEGERVRLQPANSTMTPIYASSREVAVQGVVVGLMRRF